MQWLTPKERKGYLIPAIGKVYDYIHEVDSLDERKDLDGTTPVGIRSGRFKEGDKKWELLRNVCQ